MKISNVKYCQWLENERTSQANHNDYSIASTNIPRIDFESIFLKNHMKIHGNQTILQMDEHMSKRVDIEDLKQLSRKSFGP
jgi:hypothetical protein